MAELDQRRLAGHGARVKYHHPVDCLAPPLVRHADHRHLGDGRVLGEHPFHHGRVDVLPTRDDHVFDSVSNVQVAVSVQPAGVPGVQPAAAHRLGRGLRPAPVTPAPRPGGSSNSRALDKLYDAAASWMHRGLSESGAEEVESAGRSEGLSEGVEWSPVLISSLVSGLWGAIVQYLGHG